ncbi:MAG TPA: prolipoprotein diacylglyceryl transferase family protein [Stellaceae bacterium]|jgi:prolipoprotein diacylglyceryltransferase|nr:prolipoprotein diacylglyceryl transferase family protein [Stellaceae bacterium]
MLIHTVFDVLALLTGVAVLRFAPMAHAPQPWQVHPLYIATASAGVTVGAYLAGSGNLWLSGVGGVGRSIEGALAGGIIAIETLKWRSGIAGSTGLRLVLPLAAAIAVGRIGCFFAGLDDMTYGTPTTLPWGVDFGDGVLRHPVQLYESVTMAAFFAVFLMMLRRGGDAVPRIGFYLFIGVYATQRFAWEFLKPYGTVIGPFNLFHLLSLALIGYALVFACRELRQPCRHSQPLPPVPS